jgi:hypothetical protein
MPLDSGFTPFGVPRNDAGGYGQRRAFSDSHVKQPALARITTALMQA